MYFSAFDKVRHIANHADLCPRDVVLAFEWVDQILWKVVQMELEFTNCIHSFPCSKKMSPYFSIDEPSFLCDNLI